MAAEGSGQVAANEGSTAEPIGSPSYELFILLLSILSILNLVLYGFLGPAGQQVIAITDSVLSLFFLADFLFRLGRSRPSRAYFLRHWGWADLLAIAPVLRVFRLFRVVRVARRLRGFGARRLVDQLVSNRSTSAFGLTVFLVIVVVEIAGASVVTVEQDDPEANIRTGSDAVWWAYVTITTVGYGDRYPTTGMGRILGVLLLTAGVALFSVLTGFVANFFLGSGRRRRSAEDESPEARRPIDPHGRFAELARLLDEQDARSAELRLALAELQSGDADRPPGVPPDAPRRSAS
jgi:voltage-gated potassium channel